MPPVPPIRVWRLRKNHTWIDAQIRDCVESDGVELQFFYDGALVFAAVAVARSGAHACQ